MTRAPDIRIDEWSPLSHKLTVGDGGRNSPLVASLAPTWVPDDEKRRINALTVLAAYIGNVARHFYDGGDDTTDADRDARREYGDAALMVRRVSDGVLGDTVTVAVDGADVDLPDTPDLPDRPEPLDDDASDLDRRIHTVATARWETATAAAVDAWETAIVDNPVLRDREAWLRAWADRERFRLKLRAGERLTNGLGSAVYVMSRATAAGRPIVDLHEPGFYFEVWDDNDRDYPSKIHLAWELERTEGTTKTRWVRRITYELGPIMPALDPDQPDGFARDEHDTIRLRDGDRWDDRGIVRTYPWSSDEPSLVTCYKTDGTWPLRSFGPNGLHDLSDDTAEWAIDEAGHPVRRLDLGIDFVPVVNIDDEPILLAIAQLLDDLHGLDTDVVDAAELAAHPLIHLAGADSNDLLVKAATVLTTSEAGSMTVLDLTKSLSVLSDNVANLLDRMSVNGQIPAEVLGRVEAGDDVAGITVALRHAPYRSFIEGKRLARDSKWQLILKFVQRLAQLDGALPPGPNPVARVVPGSFLTSDLAAAVGNVCRLLEAGAISKTTGLGLLVQAGFKIGDISDELERIRHEDFAGAVLLAEALASERPAADYLGVEVEPVETPVEPTIRVDRQ